LPKWLPRLKPIERRLFRVRETRNPRVLETVDGTHFKMASRHPSRKQMMNLQKKLRLVTMFPEILPQKKKTIDPDLSFWIIF
jgi:hypothetical protein